MRENTTGLLHELQSRGIDFYTGVPDSGLKALIRDIESNIHPSQHVSALHESHAVAIAVGAALAGKHPCVYLQNSGLGNIINPLTSLCMPAGVMPLLVIGHRHGLEQHQVMGEVDQALMSVLAYKNIIWVQA